MLRATTTKAMLTVLGVFFITSTCYSQEDHQAPTYRLPGESTVYTAAPTIGVSTALIPVGGTSVPKLKAPDPISYFHLEFVVKTIDSGKVTGTRTYTMDANTDRNYHAQYRSDTSEAPHTRNRTDIDCSDVRLVGTDSVSLNVGAMISSDLNPPPSAEPINANYNGSFYTLAVFGKPTVVFSADAQAPDRRIQIEVTVTPIRLNSGAKP
jgi:hypothetical protein